MVITNQYIIISFVTISKVPTFRRTTTNWSSNVSKRCTKWCVRRNRSSLRTILHTKRNEEKQTPYTKDSNDSVMVPVYHVHLPRTSIECCFSFNPRTILGHGTPPPSSGGSLTFVAGKWGSSPLLLTKGDECVKRGGSSFPNPKGEDIDDCSRRVTLTSCHTFIQHPSERWWSQS